MVTQRVVVEAIGVQQALRMWLYFEFVQDGTEVTATRGLDCGYDVVPLTAIAGAADLHRAWPKIMTNNSMNGRKGTIAPTRSGCSVSFEPTTTVDGATVSYYRDLSVALPTTTDQASGSTPGWEDWDADGDPGISYHLSGVASGAVYVAARHTNTWAGTISGTAPPFTVPDTAKHEEDLLGYDGSPLLTTTSSPSADATLRFAEFARLDATQATGDDTTTCTAVRALAPTLTPKGDEKPVQ
jgi:hypothetical protein